MHRTGLLTALTATAALALSAPALATSPPPNDDFAAAKPLVTTPGLQSVAFDLPGSTQEPGEPTQGGNGMTVWYRFTTPAEGLAHAEVCPKGPGTTARVRVFRLFEPYGPASFANLIRADLDQSELPAQESCRFHWWAEGGTPYWVQIERTDASDFSGTLRMHVDLAIDLVGDEEEAPPEESEDDEPLWDDDVAAAEPCQLQVKAPKRVRRARLRKGLRIKVTATDGPCMATLVAHGRGKRLARRTRPLEGGETKTFLVRDKRARRGRVRISVRGDGVLVRTTVKVR